MKIRGANVLVTGGARRVAKTCALALAGAGANILLHYHSSSREAARVIDQIKKFGVKAKSFQADISRLTELRNLVRDASRAFGPVDVLLNSASVFLRTPLDQLKEKEWDTVIDTNLKGSFFLAREVGLRMVKGGGGKIINIADWAGERPYKNYLPYCISKAGVIAMTKGLARSLAPKVTVNAISPGPVLLPEGMGAKDKRAILRGTPLGRIGSPEDIANTVRFLIEGTDFMTGSILTVDGGRLIA